MCVCDEKYRKSAAIKDAEGVNEMKHLRKLLAAILVLTLLCSAISITAFAAGAGAEKDPLVVETMAAIGNAYLMNDNLSAGDADGIWYQMTAYTNGIMYVEVNCSAAKGTYDVEVFSGDYVGRASESNPVITYPVSQGDTVLVHKFAKADASGKFPEVKVYVSARIVAGNEDAPVNMIDEQIKVPVKAGASVTLREMNNRVKLYGKALEVSGTAAAMKKTTITFNSATYKDVDCDGVIEMGLPGNYESRPAVTITNNSDQDVVYTFHIVASAAESDPPAVPETVPGDYSGDSTATNEDVVLLLWHTLFPEENPIDGNGDLNGDGNVTNEDVVLLLWHTLFPEENPL